MSATVFLRCPVCCHIVGEERDPERISHTYRTLEQPCTKLHCQQQWKARVIAASEQALDEKTLLTG